jgi:peptidoglycan hydrolase-like protein with peptidoglycan-binding domain
MNTPRTTIAACLVAAVAVITPVAALAADSETTASGDSSTEEAPSLQVGSTGSAVKAVQRRLSVRATGYFGTETEKAVKRFQRRKGLTADGIVAPAPRQASRRPAPHRRVRVRRQPARDLGRRSLPRQVPVRQGDVARDGRHGRSGRGSRVGAGPARAQAVPPARHGPLGQLRIALARGARLSRECP